jgi:hypothetical protein
MEKLNKSPPSQVLIVSNIALFYLSFLIFRICLHLVVDFKLIKDVCKQKGAGARKEKVVATFVAALFGLNMYWFYLINLRLVKMLQKG